MRLFIFFFPLFLSADVIEYLPTKQKVIALTFDACETKTISHFDKELLDFLVIKRIHATIFVSGKFIQRNAKEITALSKLGFIDFQNHSFTHHQDMTKLTPKQIEYELEETTKLIKKTTQTQSHLFRFPAGIYDAKTLKHVENLGYKVVHWSFPSGDPDKRVSAKKMREWVDYKSKAGNILIFHINGRGYHTAEAMPDIIKNLEAKGFRFVLLKDYL